MIRRADGKTVYAGSHVGSRGTLQSIRESGADDFSEGIPEVDFAWEQAAKAAMITREASFGARWHGDWESYDEPDDQTTALTALLWGPEYRKQERQEPPFGRR
jgi:hypothetical protein